MENRQKHPTLEQLNTLKLVRETILFRTIRINKKVFLVIWWIYTLLLSFIAYLTIFEEYWLVPLEYFFLLYFPYMFYFLILLILSVGFTKLLERWFEPIKRIALEHFWKKCFFISALMLPIVFVITPFVFRFFFFNTLVLAAVVMSFVYFPYGILITLTFQGSLYQDSFAKLKEVLVKLLKHIEKVDFVFEIKGVESDLLIGINQFNGLLRQDNIELNLDFVKTYIILLKWFGTKDDWKELCITFFNILEEYVAFDLTKIVSIFATFRQKLEDLKNEIGVAEIRPTMFQKITIFIKGRIGEISASGGASLIIIILRSIGLG